MKLFLVLFAVLISYPSNNYGRGITCSKKGFVCYDQTRFYQCVHSNGKYVALGGFQNCAEGLICRDDAELECEEDITKEFIIASNIEPFNINDIDNKLDEI